MNEPRISKIHIEYEDGSFDEIGTLPGADFPLYDLRRKRPGTKKKNEGAITGYSMGAFLFMTATTTCRRQFSELDSFDLHKMVITGKD